MFTEIVWRFLILETFVMGALCCMCTYQHPQKHFCESEFVLRVKIQEEIKLSKVSNRLSFRMKIIKVFKGDVQELNSIQDGYVILRMPVNCPVDNMKTGDKYFIFGRNEKGYIYSNTCYENKPLVIANKTFRRGLGRFYKRGCDCVDEMPQYNTKKFGCHWKYSFLVKRGDNCTWAKNRDFRDCRKGLLLTPSS